MIAVVFHFRPHLSHLGDGGNLVDQLKIGGKTVGLQPADELGRPGGVRVEAMGENRFGVRLRRASELAADGLTKLKVLSDKIHSQ